MRRSTANGGKPTYFADAPVLNPRQLVLSFLQPITTENRWDTQQVKIPVKDKGVFLVEAVKRNLSAYTILSVSDIALLTKMARGHALYYVANRTTGEPIANASISIVERDEPGTTVKTGADGTAEFTVNNKPETDLRVVATSAKMLRSATSGPGHSIARTVF